MQSRQRCGDSRDAERSEINDLRICEPDSCALITINNAHIQCIYKIITKTFIANCYFAFRMNFSSLRRCHILFFLFPHLHTFGRISCDSGFCTISLLATEKIPEFMFVDLFSIKTEMKNRNSNLLSTLIFAEN